MASVAIRLCAVTAFVLAGNPASSEMAGGFSEPFIAGPGGNLYRVVPPDQYLEGSGIDVAQYEWCLWPWGCKRKGSDEVVSLRAGPAFVAPESGVDAAAQFPNLGAGVVTFPYAAAQQ